MLSPGCLPPPQQGRGGGAEGGRASEANRLRKDPCVSLRGTEVPHPLPPRSQLDTHALYICPIKRKAADYPGEQDNHPGEVRVPSPEPATTLPRTGASRS